MLQKSQPLQPSLQVKRNEKIMGAGNKPRILPLAVSAVESFRPYTPLPASKRIAVKTTDAVHLIKIDEIIHCMADNNYCTIHYGKGLKVMVAKTLKAVGDALPTTFFQRVHNSHIVRLDTIHLVYTDHLVLDNGDSIPMSRACKKDLLTRLSDSATSL